MATKTPQLTRPEIVGLAARAVDQWFAHVASHIDALSSPGDSDLPKLDDAFEEVSRAIEAADVAEFGELTQDQDLRFWSLGRDAGYLVGVQVGLRLRNLPSTT